MRTTQTFRDFGSLIDEQEFKPRRLVCGDCGAEFDYPAEQQKRHAECGYPPPKRCKPCRQRRNARYAKPDEQS
jgi:hypothetical protein